MIEGGLEHSILKRAKENNLIDVECINIRDFSNNKHNHVDDYPYGGGAGMLMQAEPVYQCRYGNATTTYLRCLYEYKA